MYSFSFLLKVNGINDGETETAKLQHSICWHSVHSSRVERLTALEVQEKQKTRAGYKESGNAAK